MTRTDVLPRVLIVLSMQADLHGTVPEPSHTFRPDQAAGGFELGQVGPDQP
jgi:hypothetical protein